MSEEAGTFFGMIIVVGVIITLGFPLGRAIKTHKTIRTINQKNM